MFGLISYKSAILFEDDKKFHNFHYCGVCKTISKYYKNKCRIFLNSDIVFLTELIYSVIVKINLCEQVNKTPSNTRKFFDFNKVSYKEKLLFKFTSSINVYLVYLKVKDNIDDSKYTKKIFWKLVERLYKKQFDRSIDELVLSGFPIIAINKIIESQKKREAENTAFETPILTLKYYSELTGKITGLISMNLAKTLNLHDFYHYFYILGNEYGKMIYIIDAIKDYKKDRKQKQFNPFSLLFNPKQHTFPDKMLEDINKYLDIKTNIIIKIANNLISDKNRLIYFSNNLYSSIRNLFREQKIQIYGLSKKIEWAKEISEKMTLGSVCRNNLSKLRYIKNSFSYMVLFFSILLFPKIGLNYELVLADQGTECFQTVGGLIFCILSALGLTCFFKTIIKSTAASVSCCDECIYKTTGCERTG